LRDACTISGEKSRAEINAAMDVLLNAATGSTGSYVSESDFERSWKDSF